MTNLSYFHPLGSKSGLLREGSRIEGCRSIFYDYVHYFRHWASADNFFTNAAFGDRREPYILQTIGIFDLKRHSFKGQL